MALTTPDAARKEDGHRWPLILPGGKAALFSVMSLNLREEERTIDVVLLETGARRTLVRGGSYPRYVDGYLLYGQAGALLAAPFDLSRLELTGPAVPVIEDVRMDPKWTGHVYVDVAASGSLVYVPGYPKPGERSLVWVDRHGKIEPVTSEKRAFSEVRLSPDGQHLAVIIQGSSDSLWIYDLRRNSWNRLTFEGDVTNPAWTPDGKRVLFASNQNGPHGLFGVPADGSGKPEELALRTGWVIYNPSVSADGRLALVLVQDARGQDPYSLSLAGGHALEPFLATPADEREVALSPSGRFVVYSSNESGRFDVYVRPFPGPGRKWTVSTGGGTAPVWRRDGRELFYWERDRLIAVPMRSATELSIGAPQVLFQSPVLARANYFLTGYDVTFDGQRFVMIKPEPREEAPLQIVMIPDFVEEMKARLAAGKK